MQKVLFLISFSILFSCAVSKTKLSDDGSKVKILASNKNPECHVLDKVIGENEKGSDELAKNHARNLAANLDGDAIYIDDMVNNANMVKVYATVYQCKKD